jgi:hypothetical protein
MRNVTLSAAEELIERARLRARREKKTLNAVFRAWLERYAGAGTGPQEYKHLMGRLTHVRTKRSFTRDEMNAR